MELALVWSPAPTKISVSMTVRSRLVCLLAALVIGSAQADVITDWNALMIDAIRAENNAPTLATRNLAVLHAAIYSPALFCRGRRPFRYFSGDRGHRRRSRSAAQPLPERSRPFRRSFGQPTCQSILR